MDRAMVLLPAPAGPSMAMMMGWFNPYFNGARLLSAAGFVLNRVICDYYCVGLDIYVGSLTRYYSGDWEMVAQKAARELGLELTVVRAHDPEDAIRDPEAIRPVVLAWREQLSEALAESITDKLDWDESQEAPYFTDKPTWDC